MVSNYENYSLQQIRVINQTMMKKIGVGGKEEGKIIIHIYRRTLRKSLTMNNTSNHTNKNLIFILIGRKTETKKDEILRNRN